MQIGDTFGRWTIIGEAPVALVGKNHKRFRQWQCRCECGTERPVYEHSLKRGTSVSCGCYNRERSSESGTKHGATKTPEYKVWTAMKDRCYNPNNKRYADYGGRGILVSKRWYNNFQAFLDDMGPRPSPRHSIDRIDNDKSYNRNNCQWSLPTEQMVNRRGTQMVDNVPLATLAKRYGIPANTLRFRILKGWELQDALTRPVRPKRAHRVVRET
jgi:hypothetical protein